MLEHSNSGFWFSERLKWPCPERVTWPCSEKVKWPCPERVKWPCPERATWPHSERVKWPCPERVKWPCPERAKWPCPERAKWPSPEKAVTSPGMYSWACSSMPDSSRLPTSIQMCVHCLHYDITHNWIWYETRLPPSILGKSETKARPEVIIPLAPRSRERSILTACMVLPDSDKQVTKNIPYEKVSRI